jgi:hypothetical protein
MKNVIKILSFAVVCFAAKVSVAQVNVGAQTVTKIVTQTILPTVNAATTQKVINQATNVAGKVANQTQAAVQAAQGQAANVSGQVSSTTQSAVQASQSQAASMSGSVTSTDALNVTADKNEASVNGSSSTTASVDKGKSSITGSLTSSGSAGISKSGASFAGSSATDGKAIIGAGSSKVNTAAHGIFSATADKTASAKAALSAKKTRATAFGAATVSKSKAMRI